MDKGGSAWCLQGLRQAHHQQGLAVGAVDEPVGRLLQTAEDHWTADMIKLQIVKDDLQELMISMKMTFERFRRDKADLGGKLAKWREYSNELLDRLVVPQDPSARGQN